MARFDVFRSADGSGYILDVQTDLLSGLNTRVVVPLLPEQDSPKPAKDLNPVFDVEGETVVMVTQYMSSIPEPELKHFVVNLESQHRRISDALDLLFVGF